MIIRLVIFYAVAGISIGAIIASMHHVDLRWKGRPVRAQRLIAFVIAAAFWPLFAWQFLFGPLPGNNR